MIVCGVASTRVSRMSTLYILSTPNGIVRWMPGCAKRLYLPSRSMNARCVGRTMRMPERMVITISAMMTTMMMSAASPISDYPFRCARGGRTAASAHDEVHS